MADNIKFNKIMKKLDGRHLSAKIFYDFYDNKIDIGRNEIYLKKEVDSILAMLKEIHVTHIKEFNELKKLKDDMELENYKLQKKLKRKNGTTRS